MVILDDPDPIPTAENNHDNNEVFSYNDEPDVYDLSEVTFQLSFTYSLSGFVLWSLPCLQKWSYELFLEPIIVLNWIINTCLAGIDVTICWSHFWNSFECCLHTIAKDMWEELQSRFNQGNAPQLYHIKKEVNSFS